MPMTPLAVFFKTLSRTSAIFLGTVAVFLNPPLDWGASRTATAVKGPRQATIDGLIYALRDPDSGVRREVARALEAYAVIDAQRAAVTELTRELAATDAVTRARAACQLREAGDEAAPAMDALLTLLADTAPVPQSACGDRWRRGFHERLTTPGEQAASALVAIGTRSFDPLLRSLKHSAWSARRNAAWALGAMDDERAVKALIDALKDPEPQVREQAAWALGAIGDHRAMDPLLPLLKDADVRVRRQAAWAIGVVTK